MAALRNKSAKRHGYAAPLEVFPQPRMRLASRVVAFAANDNARFIANDNYSYSYLGQTGQVASQSVTVSGNTSSIAYG